MQKDPFWKCKPTAWVPMQAFKPWDWFRRLGMLFSSDCRCLLLWICMSMLGHDRYLCHNWFVCASSGPFLVYTRVVHLVKDLLRYGQDTTPPFNFMKLQLRGDIGRIPGGLFGWIFAQWLFMLPKSSHQNLSKVWPLVKLYFELTRSWSLSCSNIFW